MMCKHDVASSPTIPNHGEIEMPACRSPRLHDRDTAGHVAQALRQASRGGNLLYAPVVDRHLAPELADRVFCFYDMQGAGLRQRRSISEEMATRAPGRPSHEMALVVQAEAKGTNRGLS